MCGRFNLSTPPEILASLLGVLEFPAFKARYNIAPTQSAPVVRASVAGAVARRADLFRWGLIPSWANEASIGARAINARSETAAEKPMFRTPLRRQRCLVPADGFYEWRALEKGRQPYHIRMADRTPFAFAGLWDRWNKGPEAPIESFTILVTSPNELLRPLHDRMPVIVDRRDYALWLDPGVHDPARVAGLLKPYPAERMEAYPVSGLVNSPANDDARCVEPVSLQ